MHISIGTGQIDSDQSHGDPACLSAQNWASAGTAGQQSQPEGENLKIEQLPVLGSLLTGLVWCSQW